MQSKITKHVPRLLPSEVVFMECDMQVKIAKMMKNMDTATHNNKRLARVAKILDIPYIATRQMNFGDIVPEIVECHPPQAKVFDKVEFSMLEQPISDYLTSLKKNKIVLFGIEAHVCIKQTALDLLERNCEVHLVIDAITSMNYHDRTLGIEALRDRGCIITSFQSLMFELMRSAKHPKFKEILNVVKDMPKEHLHLHQELHKI